MDLLDLKKLVRLGEDSRRQFKADVRSADSLASDLVAFSNTSGGTLCLGVADDGSLAGLPPEDVRRLNQLIGNAATQHIRSPISPITENVSVGKERVVIVVHVAEGIDKPYFDRHGVIWVKAGSDKRRIQSKEELRRLFQEVDLLHADEIPTSGRLEVLDRIRFREFLGEAYGQELPDDEGKLGQLLENMNLARDRRLNLAGLLLFGRRPQVVKPAFILKAVHYPGFEVSGEQYLDNEDFEGPLRKLFEGGMGFVLRNLPKVQAGRGVNDPGETVVPRIVFEELLVNALIHRDYFISAPVRVFMFSDRVEIVSPGNLHNHLTVEKILAGNSVMRNPILASFASKGLLPYRGLGTGITRARAEWPGIEFVDDREACTFKAIIRPLKVQGGPPKHPEEDRSEPIKRKDEPMSRSDAPIKRGREPIKWPQEALGEPINEIQVRILQVLLEDSGASYDQLAEKLGTSRTTVMRWIQVLKAAGILVRVGSRKAGHWEIDLGESQP